MSAPCVGICVPSKGQPALGFLRSAVKIVSAVMQHGPAVLWFDAEGTEVPQSRYGLALQAIKEPVTHLLWLDDDMELPGDCVHRFLDAGKDIVGANYRRRRPPYLGTATSLADAVVDSVGQVGLERVRSIGFGCALVRREVFEAIPQPWFLCHWDPAVEGYYTEDVYFCDRAREVGFEVWVDHGLSRDVAHIGTVAWRFRSKPNG